MNVRWAGHGLVLACLALVPHTGGAQAAQRITVDAATGSSLGQNYPNPVSRETTIPFAIGAPDCGNDAGRRYRVTLRVYNMLAQLVAIPTLQSSSTGGASGEQVRDVLLTCGQYSAQWDGTHQGTGRQAASGIYLYRLEVEGRPIVRRMTVIR
jgi:hypothetical protein